VLFNIFIMLQFLILANDLFKIKMLLIPVKHVERSKIFLKDLHPV